MWELQSNYHIRNTLAPGARLFTRDVGIEQRASQIIKDHVSPSKLFDDDWAR